MKSHQRIESFSIGIRKFKRYFKTNMLYHYSRNSNYYNLVTVTFLQFNPEYQVLLNKDGQFYASIWFCGV